MTKFYIKQKIDVVILCGGLGTRIKKLSKGIPKSLIPINKKNILTYIINEIKKYNFNKIYLLTGYKSKLFKRYNKVKPYLIPIECLAEKKLMGTGGSLYQLKKKKINDFLLINGDSLLLTNYLDLVNLNKKKIGSIALTKNKNYKSNNKLANLSLKKNLISFTKKEKLMNGGVYFFKKNFLNLIKNEFFSLENDLLENLIRKKSINGISANNFFLDIGTSKNLKEAPKILFDRFNKPAVFLDRDGVINYDYGYVSKFKNFILRPGVLKGLKLLQKKDYLIFIITNQAGIAKKKFSENDFEKLHLKFKDFHLKNGILINDLVYCPYHKESKIKKYRIDSDWRKPNNGMIRHLLKNYDINMSKSFMIGDNESDKKCANKSKIYFEYSKKNFYTQVKNILERRNYDKK